jgi:hypothetical protein
VDFGEGCDSEPRGTSSFGLKTKLKRFLELRVWSLSFQGQSSRAICPESFALWKNSFPSRGYFAFAAFLMQSDQTILLNYDVNIAHLSVEWRKSCALQGILIALRHSWWAEFAYNGFRSCSYHELDSQALESRPEVRDSARFRLRGKKSRIETCFLREPDQWLVKSREIGFVTFMMDINIWISCQKFIATTDRWNKLR